MLVSRASRPRRRNGGPSQRDPGLASPRGLARRRQRSSAAIAAHDHWWLVRTQALLDVFSQRRSDRQTGFLPGPNRLRDGVGLASPIIGNLCPACRRRTSDPHGVWCGAVEVIADVPAGAGSQSFVVDVVVVVCRNKPPMQSGVSWLSWLAVILRPKQQPPITSGACKSSGPQQKGDAHSFLL